MMTNEQKKLKQRTAKEWLSKIVSIRNKNVRIKIARLVWWDYVKNGDLSWHVLDKYSDMKLEKEPSSILTEKALLKIGYSSAQAKKRSCLPKKTNEEQGK